jgi:hypothetical protein
MLGSWFWAAVMTGVLAADDAGVKSCGGVMQPFVEVAAFRYQLLMNTALILSQQFLSPMYLSSHHTRAGLFLFSWCRNNLVIDSGAMMCIILTKSSSYALRSVVRSISTEVSHYVRQVLMDRIRSVSRHGAARVGLGEEPP